MPSLEHRAKCPGRHNAKSPSRPRSRLPTPSRPTSRLLAKFCIGIAVCCLIFLFWTLALSRNDVVDMKVGSSRSIPFWDTHINPDKPSLPLDQLQGLEEWMTQQEKAVKQGENNPTLVLSNADVETTENKEPKSSLGMVTVTNTSNTRSTSKKKPAKTCVGVDRPTPTRVQVVGTYDSGTNWLSTLIAANFLDISICNVLPGYSVKFEPWVMWKHTHLNLLEESDKDMIEGKYHIPDFERRDDRSTTFFIVLFKDINAWLRSMEKISYGSLSVSRKGYATGTRIYHEDLLITPEGNFRRHKGKVQGKRFTREFQAPFFAQVTCWGWSFFDSVVDMWCHFYKNWMFSLGLIEEEVSDRQCGPVDVHADSIPCFSGMFIYFNDLVTDTVQVLKKIRDVLDKAGVKKRATPLDAKAVRPKKMKRVTTRWELVDGFWIQKNPAPYSHSSYESVKKNINSSSEGDSETREKAQPLFEKLMSFAV